jgi:hypothetical protein
MRNIFPFFTLTGEERKPVFVNLFWSPGIDSSLADSNPWYRFLGSLDVSKFGLWSHELGLCSVAKFVVTRKGNIVDSGIGLSYRPASLCSLAGRYVNPMPESTLSHQSGTTNLATGSGMFYYVTGSDLANHSGFRSGSRCRYDETLKAFLVIIESFDLFINTKLL